ncbi:MAG: GAF domain-containing protein [Synergistes sp.]|nr:GAF domain-containing protein [Synergistes sp.]
MDYQLLNEKLIGLSRGVDYDITILANASALIYRYLAWVSWCGFYILMDGSLKLGPFQGKYACAKIMPGEGVCGTAAAEDRTVVVPNVSEFDGYIACDNATNSEIVIPIHRNGRLFAVWDLDSIVYNRFSPEDVAGLEFLVRSLENILDTIDVK